MKKGKGLWKVLTGIVLACAFILPISSVQLHAAEYEIVFKAGAHGSIDGEKEAAYRLTSDSLFPNEPDINVENGYVFIGWNKELPEVGSKVTGKMVFVAKYAVVIDGVSYTIRYVDENKVDIATPRTMLGEKGESITARAKNIAGYTYQNAEQTFSISDGLEVQFVYTLTNPDEVIRYETTTQNVVVNQNVNGNNAQQNTQTQNGGNQGTANTPAPTPEEENNEDPEQPLGSGEEEENKNNETPLSKGKQEQNMMVAAAGGFAVLLGLILIMLLKKRKDKKEA